MKRYSFAVVIEKDPEGYYASCPQVQGCYAQGESYEEALENIRDVIKLLVEDMEANGKAVPDQHSVSLITLEVAV